MSKETDNKKTTVVKDQKVKDKEINDLLAKEELVSITI
jgi:hypothetical protein